MVTVIAEISGNSLHPVTAQLVGAADGEEVRAAVGAAEGEAVG